MGAEREAKGRELRGRVLLVRAASSRMRRTDALSDADDHNGTPSNDGSMASAVASLMGSEIPDAAFEAESATATLSGAHQPAAPNSAATHSTNLQSYLDSQAHAAAPAPSWQDPSFEPVTRTLVQAVRELRLQDVRWFLHQLDLAKNGPKKRVTANATPAGTTPTTTAGTPANGSSTSPSNVPSTPGTAGLVSPISPIPPTPPSPSFVAAAALPDALRTPSPLLASLPDDALALPTSSPYIMDTLFDAFVGLQSQRSMAETRAIKARNRERARKEGVPQRLVDLLTPLPPVAIPTLSLPPGVNEDAHAIMHALVAAVDVVGVQVVSAAACVDFLKVSDVPYPVVRKDAPVQSLSSPGSAAAALAAAAVTYSSISADDQSEWSVTPEWRRRVKLLQQFGAVLDVDHTEEGADKEATEVEAGEEAKGGEEKKEQQAQEHKRNGSTSKSPRRTPSASPASADASAVPPAALLSATLTFPILLPSPPTLSWFVHPPFSLSSRSSQERYLQHQYLSLLAQRKTFLRILTDSLAAVRANRAAGNHALLTRAQELQARDTRITADVARFERELSATAESVAAAKTEAAMAAIQAEATDRETQATLQQEWAAHRAQVAVRGERIIRRDAALLEDAFALAQERLRARQDAGSAGLLAVDSARAKLREVNLQYERLSIALEAADKRREEVSARVRYMEHLVGEYEAAIKTSRRSLKETRAMEEHSRASQAALSVVELSFSARNVSTLFWSPSALSASVSNLFLKLFRCMSGPPDPADPNPEVVWDPEPACVTELCSPGANRTQAAVAARPSWRVVRMDLWKLCAAERGRYFKVEVWDCDASVKHITKVVRSAIDQAKVDAETKAAAMAQQASLSPPVLNSDGTAQAPAAPTTPASAVPSSVTLPSSAEVRYGYIGQSVLTLQHLLDAQARREAEARVTPSDDGLLRLPIIHAERWAQRKETGYTDSGTLIISSMKVVDKE